MDDVNHSRAGDRETLRKAFGDWCDNEYDEREQADVVLDAGFRRVAVRDRFYPVTPITEDNLSNIKHRTQCPHIFMGEVRCEKTPPHLEHAGHDGSFFVQWQEQQKPETEVEQLQHKIAHLESDLRYWRNKHVKG